MLLLEKSLGPDFSPGYRIFLSEQGEQLYSSLLTRIFRVNDVIFFEFILNSNKI
ncbi:hypothetical protein BSG1_00310 [Bacillus sp. SG-1]|nr:hypothetical protein BSG1_00310 [Bacillus sp. SG-1]